LHPVLLQPAYVLHRRPYRETSFLVELLTPDHGRLTVIARGVRKARAQTAGLLQPFIPLFVSWSGKGELMLLTHVETRAEAKPLQGDCLFAGFYLNELMMALLQKWDAHPQIYAAYETTLLTLQHHRLEEKTLRAFEKKLLDELGYGLLPKADVSLHNTIVPDKYYRFTSENGFIVSELGDEVRDKASIFTGKSLLAIAREDWLDEDGLQAAKRLMRYMLAGLLGSKRLYSRLLFVQPEEESVT
jgi:DNA repair protein RecO (recombination protein O)